MVRFLKFFLLAICAVPLATGCNGCNDKASSANTIIIVSSLPRTGSAQGQTDTIVNGIKMALEEIDNKITLNGVEFKIEYQDIDDATPTQGQWDAQRESSNASNAVKNPDVMVYIGPYNSGAAKVSAPILNEGGLLQISPAVTYPGFTKPGTGEANEPGVYQKGGKKTFTRVVPADDLQGTKGAKWAKSLGVKTVYILDDKEVYGQGIANIFKATCKQIGIEVLGHDSIDPKQTDFRTKLSQIKNLNPDLLYVGATSQSGAGQIAKDMVAVGLNKCKMMGPDGCFEQAFIQAAGADTFKTLDCYLTFPGIAPEKLTGKGKEFVDRYKQKYGKDPEAFAIYGYECGKVAIEAIKRSGKKDREAIRAAAFTIKDFEEGALGKWSLDENGDTTIDVVNGVKVGPGKFEPFDKPIGD